MLSVLKDLCEPMQKSLALKEYNLFLAFLKEARQNAGLTQVQLAKKLKTTQSFVSKCERGERRLDIMEVRRWASALKLTLPEFTSGFELYIKKSRKMNG